jgi:hypothetical protein
LKPNDLLQWKGIEWASTQGLRRHSLGGAHPFLTRFGGTVIPVIRYRIDRTLLRKHDLREAVLRIARTKLSQMPPSVQEKVRRALGKKVASAGRKDLPKVENPPEKGVSGDSRNPGKKQ